MKKVPDTNKYQVENHTVTTTDGYILQIFRVRLVAAELAKLSPSLQKNSVRPVVITHGLFADAGAVIEDENKSFGYWMINHGFDVWLPSNRGSKYSTQHTNPDISREDYYAYSFAEMGLVDQPAFYKFILGYAYADKPDQKIIYIGHSEGTSQMFAALVDQSTKDYMRKHTERFVALAPIVYMTNVTMAVLEVVPQFEKTIAWVAEHLGIFQIGSLNCDFPNLALDSTQNWACKNLKFMCNKTDIFPDNWKLKGKLGIDFSNSGASLQQLVHYGQLINGGAGKDPIFTKYDYGNKEKNQAKYGTDTAPEWSLEDFTTPLNLIGFSKDDMGTLGNTDILIAKLGHIMETYDVIPDWAHATCQDPKDPTPLFNILERLFVVA